jgi:spore maturation protein CgeB
MRIVLFYHSLFSDWNHGNAHFLRGVATELVSRGHEVIIYEPKNSWSRTNLLMDNPAALEDFPNYYPTISAHLYDPETLDVAKAVEGADLVIVHEWNSPELIQALGNERKVNSSFRLLFHDTHHRMISDSKAISRNDFHAYDGVLAFGQALSFIYLRRSLANRVWVWHEAADTRIFKPNKAETKEGDLIWIGNWGDEERTNELKEFLFEPSKALNLKTSVYGVRYPESGIQSLKDNGIYYGGWIANYKVPEKFSKFHATVHIPRGPYVNYLPGIPTIRVFEALACGIPLISAPWLDTENLFHAGKDYLVARNGRAMTKLLDQVLHEPELANELSRNGLQTITTQHTCVHRVDQLLDIYAELTGVPESVKRKRESVECLAV